MPLPVWATQLLGTVLNLGIQAGGQYMSNKVNEWASGGGGSHQTSSGNQLGAMTQSGSSSSAMSQSGQTSTSTVQQGSVSGLANFLATALGTPTGNNTQAAFNASQGSATTANNLMANQWNNANILNLLSTGQANLMNMLSQTSAKSYNAKQAELARQWQRAMRQTAYQDTVEDMKKAGLNPILAAQNGATSTPSSSGASIGGTTYAHAQAAAIPSAKTAAMSAMYDYGNNNAQVVQNYAQAIMSAKQLGQQYTASQLSQQMSQITDSTSKQVAKTSQIADSVHSQSRIGGSKGSGWNAGGEVSIGGSRTSKSGTKTYDRGY